MTSRSLITSGHHDSGSRPCSRVVASKFRSIIQSFKEGDLCNKDRLRSLSSISGIINCSAIGVADMKPSPRDRLGFFLERFKFLHRWLLERDGEVRYGIYAGQKRYINRINGHVVIKEK